MSRKKRALLLAILVLVILNISFIFSLRITSGRPLTVTFLSIGQGDAILIEAQGGEEILIDGGPDRSVLRELPKVMGPLDRTIDLVIATHPDKDHIAGLADVFARYDVGAYLEPDVESDTSFAKALDYAAANEKDAISIIARRGMRIHLGGSAYADVLFPDRGVRHIETNTGSIVVQLVHGENEFMLTGDAPDSIEEWLVSLAAERLQSDVLKAGHHGSKTSTGEAFLEAVSPRYVVVSAGKGNSYGHPHEEVVQRIRVSGATILSTIYGPVRFVSDGKSLQTK